MSQPLFWAMHPIPMTMLALGKASVSNSQFPVCMPLSCSLEFSTSKSYMVRFSVLNELITWQCWLWVEVSQGMEQQGRSGAEKNSGERFGRKYRFWAPVWGEDLAEKKVKLKSFQSNSTTSCLTGALGCSSQEGKLGVTNSLESCSLDLPAEEWYRLLLIELTHEH